MTRKIGQAEGKNEGGRSVQYGVIEQTVQPRGRGQGSARDVKSTDGEKRVKEGVWKEGDCCSRDGGGKNGSQ